MKTPTTRTTATHLRLLPFAFSLTLLIVALPLAAADGKGAPKAFFGSDGTDANTVFFSNQAVDTLFGPRAVIGVQLVDVTPELRQHYGAGSEAGVLVSRVFEDSPAQQAGIEVGDLITAVDGKPVSSASQLGRAIRQLEQGDTIVIELWRDGRLQQLTSGVEIDDTAAHFPAASGILKGLSETPIMDALKNRGDGDTVWELRMAPETWKQFNGSMDELRKSFDDPAFKGKFEALRRDREGLEAKIERLETRLQELEQKLKALDER